MRAFGAFKIKTYSAKSCHICTSRLTGELTQNYYNIKDTMFVYDIRFGGNVIGYWLKK